VATRLDVYEARTAPLIDYYRERGLLRPVDGVGALDEIYGRITAALA
jgi:adenylate kinase